MPKIRVEDVVDITGVTYLRGCPKHKLVNPEDIIDSPIFDNFDPRFVWRRDSNTYGIVLWEERVLDRMWLLAYVNRNGGQWETSCVKRSTAAKAYVPLEGEPPDEVSEVFRKVAERANLN